MVARDFFEVLISYEFFSMPVVKVARKSIGERVNSGAHYLSVFTTVGDYVTTLGDEEDSFDLPCGVCVQMWMVLCMWPTLLAVEFSAYELQITVLHTSLFYSIFKQKE